MPKQLSPIVRKKLQSFHQVVQLPAKPVMAPRFFGKHEKTSEFEYVMKYAIRSRRGIQQQIPKVNQDAYIVCPQIGGKSYMHFFAVCDGHGVNGHHVSKHLKEFFPPMINKMKSLIESNPTQVIRNIFESSIRSLKGSQIDTSFSGSTMIAVLMIHDKLYSFNLGDSRVISFQQKDQWQCIPLSRDHKPSETDEAERIVNAGGRIEPFKDQHGIHQGPLRVWSNRNMPGLAMSRSIGDDVAHTVGVIDIPEVKFYTMDPSWKGILIGSDGLFDFMDNEELTQTFKQAYDQDLDMTCNTLLDLASQNWMENCNVVDDITFILISMSY